MKENTQKLRTLNHEFVSQKSGTSDQNLMHEASREPNTKNSMKKKLFKGYSKIHELKMVTIGLASPDKIKSWAEKELPNGKIFGEVTNANTFHYRTFKPSKGGLFCERIFGPIKDFECACGKRQKPTALESRKILEHEQTKRYFCPNCDVEYTWSIIRRYQLGYIKLNAPVAHLWYFKTNPSYLSILFDMKRKHLESIIYCTESITLENMWKATEQNSKIHPSATELYKNWQKFFFLEEKNQKYSMMNEKKKKAKKQKKIFFRGFQERRIFQKIHWLTLKNEICKTEIEKNNLFSQNLESVQYFESVSQKKTNILLNIQKQKQKQFFSNSFESIWKIFLKKLYKKAVFEFHLQQNFSKNIYFWNSKLPPYDFSKTQNIGIPSINETPNLLLTSSRKFEIDGNKTLKYCQKFGNISFFLNSSWNSKFSADISNPKHVDKSFYLEAFSKKNHKYGNFQNFSISFESVKKDFLESSSLGISDSNFGTNDSKRELTKYQKIEQFWNSFYFLFESGILFISLKTKKINRNSMSKKNLLFLFNVLPFFQKIFLLKNTSTQLFQKIQIFLFRDFFVSQKKRKPNDWNTKISKDSWNQDRRKKKQKSKRAKLSNIEKKEVTKKFTATKTNRKQPYFLSFQFLKNSKETKQIKLQIERTSIWPLEFLVASFEKIFKILKEYSQIVFCMFVQKRWLDEIESNTGNSKDFQKLSTFPFLLLVSEQIRKKIDSSISENISVFSNAQSNQLKIMDLIGNQGKNPTDFLNSGKIEKDEYFSFSEFESIFSFMFEKTLFEYFSLFLFFPDFQFIFPNHSNFKKNSFKNVQVFAEEQVKTRFQKRKNQNFSNDLFGLNFLQVFNTSIRPQDDLQDDQRATGGNILTLQKCFILSFLFFSGFSAQLFQKKQKSFKQNESLSKYSKNIAERKQNSEQLNQIPLQLSRTNSKIENFQFLFGKKLSKKMQFQKKWQIQKQINSPISPNEKNRKIKHASPFSYDLQSSEIGRNKQTKFFNKEKNIEKFCEQKEKISTFNFSLFSKKKQKSQPYQTSNFFKNFVYTIAYNFLWNNDSDWKYFVYYNSFFVQKFEDLPIVEYTSKNSFSTNSNGENSFASVLSHQIDSFQKNFFIGTGILEKFLTEYTSLELRKMTKQHQIFLPKINQTIRLLKQTTKTKKDGFKIRKYFQKREHIIRRLKFLRKFFRRNSNPHFMILRNLPVLPPDLRPILKLQNQIAASDLNRFYQRIIYRNDRFKKFSKDSVTNQSFEIQYAQRLLQEAVDNLIQNGKGGVNAETNSRGQAFKSLSEILKGKQGRFRQYLLGKRVDYSGRSVIVVGPQLKLYECGIPKEMAFELFLPFLIQYILHSKLAQTVIGAKNLLKKNFTLTFHLLKNVMKHIPVLLNRAPTLHRLGFQAFLPKLIEGRAILLHPMVCPAFNADFDGDQMAVHIPLTVEARTEAWKFMLASNNLINSATGEPILLPSQDMVLGCYYLTLDYSSKSAVPSFLNLFNKHSNHSTPRHSPEFQTSVEPNQNFRPQKRSHFQYFIRQQKSFFLYNNFQEILAAYQKKEINLHTSVWVKLNVPVNFANEGSKPIEIRLQKNGYWQLIQPKYTNFYDQTNSNISKFIRTTPGRVFMNLMIQQCAGIQNQ